MRIQALCILISLTLSSCFETNTTDPVETYKYWAGHYPPADVEVIEGQYWESAHWSREYILYLKIKPSDEWWNEFLKQNSLVQDATSWTPPSNSPSWFKAPEKVTRYKPADEFFDSHFIRDDVTGEFYIYIIQL